MGQVKETTDVNRCFRYLNIFSRNNFLEAGFIFQSGRGLHFYGDREGGRIVAQEEGVGVHQHRCCVEKLS